jgi:hypothetical protein
MADQTILTKHPQGKGRRPVQDVYLTPKALANFSPGLERQLLIVKTSFTFCDQHILYTFLPGASLFVRGSCRQKHRRALTGANLDFAHGHVPEGHQ